MGHKYRLMVYTGLICYRIGFRGGLSWTESWTFGFHERRIIYWPAERLLLSKRYFYSGLWRRVDS
jgi:hypothetical protein